MTQNFTSVTLFYVALRDVLLTTVGMTIERTLSTHDLILTNGSGGLARLRMVVVSPTVSAVCLTLGTDPDVLAVVAEDPELCLPFNTSATDRIYASIEWSAERGVLQVVISPNALDPYTATAPLRCYRAEFFIADHKSSVRHEDIPFNEFAPNFKTSGGPYLQVGA